MAQIYLHESMGGPGHSLTLWARLEICDTLCMCLKFSFFSKRSSFLLVYFPISRFLFSSYFFVFPSYVPFVSPTFLSPIRSFVNSVILFFLPAFTFTFCFPFLDSFSTLFLSPFILPLNFSVPSFL